MPGKKRSNKKQPSRHTASIKAEVPIISPSSKDSKDRDSLILALNHKVFELSKMLEEKNPDIAELQSRILDANSIIERLKEDIELLKKKNSFLENENLELKGQIGNLDWLASNQKMLQMKISEKERALSEANSKLAQTSGEHFEHEQRIFAAKNRILDADRIIRRLKAENEALAKNLESQKSSKESVPTWGAERLKAAIEEKSKEVLELKSMMLKGEREKDSLKKMVSSLESQVSLLQATVKALQENLAERDNIDEELNSDIEGLKRQVAERDVTIAQLRMHFQQRNRIDEQLSFDIISLKKNIAEKNNAISELLKNNRSLVEMSRASDSAAKERGDALSMARNETDKLKREIERLNSLIQKQQAEHKKTADDLSAGFELQKQMMLEESTEKEVALNTRIKELEELLEDAKRSMQVRNEEMTSMVKNLNEQSRTLLSNMSKPIAEAPPDEFNIMPPRAIRKPMKQARVITQQPAKGMEEKIKREAAAAVAPPLFTQRGRIPEIISAIDIASSKQPMEKIRQSLLSSGYSASEIDEAIARWNSQNKK
ncbi:MAG: hypothetical protein NTZ02_04590 [Candidatus Woesearchaeota archaeon]|nr:hypothetical protein [Candidatus Woesearchaeota archaeon]